jgi:hypothetical protein
MTINLVVSGLLVAMVFLLVLIAIIALCFYLKEKNDGGRSGSTSWSTSTWYSWTTYSWTT